MKRFHQLLFITLACFALSGCGARVANSDFSFSHDPDAAIAIFSVTHDRKPGTAPACVYFRVNSDDYQNLQVLQSQNSVAGVLGNEFDDDYGQLLPIVLPAGTHRLDGWDLSNGTGMDIYPKQQPAPIVFTLKAGEVKYLGNLHACLATGENFLGLPITYAGYPEIRDRNERDIPMFEERYPQFKDKVIIDLLPLGPWVADYNITKRSD